MTTNTNVLEHDELIYLARLAHHCTGADEPLSKILDKLMEYADRNGSTVYKLAPLKLVLVDTPEKRAFYGDRVLFKEEG